MDAVVMRLLRFARNDGFSYRRRPGQASGASRRHLGAEAEVLAPPPSELCLEDRPRDGLATSRRKN
jgi:hypothetical protein